MATQDTQNGREKNNNKPAMLSKAGLIILALAFLTAIVLDAFFSDEGIIHIKDLNKKYVELLNRIDELERENAALQQRIDDLQSNPDAVEAIAREELGMIKPGEKVYLFPQDDTSK